MKPRSILKSVLLIGVFLNFNCANNNRVYKVEIKKHTLTYADIYNTDIIKDVLFDAEEQNVDSLKTASRTLFLKAVDEYKNKNNAIGSISIFKSSILIFPDAKTYYELGNALLDIKSKPAYEDALKAFTIAADLNFQPLYNVYYKQAIAYNLTNKHNDNADEFDYGNYDVINALRNAFYNGYSDTTALKNDSRLANIIKSPQYKELLISLKVKKLGENKDGLFEVFKDAFPNTTGYIEIPKTEVDMKKYKESISYDFARFIPEMQNTNFSREVSHDYFYVAKAKETDLYTALIYTSISFYGGEMQPVQTTLAVYNNQNGDIISRKNIACQCSAEKIRSSIVNNGEIILEDFERKWEKPIDQVAFEENSIVEFKLIAKAKFEIDAQGNIIAKQVDKSFNDTLITASK